MKIKLNVAAIATIVTITLTGMIAMRCFASDAPEIDVATIASYWTKIHSRLGDLLAIAKSTRSLDDKEMLQDVINAAGEIESEIGHIKGLLQIKSVMRDEADKQTISDYIRLEIKTAVELITLDIEVVNRSMTNLKSPAGVTEASKLKDDLHGLKELLQP